MYNDGESPLGTVITPLALRVQPQLVVLSRTYETGSHKSMQCQPVAAASVAEQKEGET